MFEQNPVLGPGTGSTTTHTLEILLMLAGAFLLGLWLGWLLWNRFKAAHDELQLEHEATKLRLGSASVELETAQKRIAQFEADHAGYRARIDSLTADYHDSEARLQHLNGHLSQLSEKAASLELELAALRPAEIPMEVIESPVDVHVESLIEGLPAAEPEVLVVEKPVVETPKIDAPTIEQVAFAPAPVSEPVGTKTHTGGPVVIERVIDHQPYVEPVVEATPAVEPLAEIPAAPPVFSFTPAASADDLRIVEGIGPKIEQVLNENGISTFRQLADASEERLREILAAAGSRFKMHDPSSWPEQARLAETGDWEALKTWQDILKGGRETGGHETPAYGEIEPQVVAETGNGTNGIYPEPEFLPNSALVADGYGAAVTVDDLKVVEGIGPKIEELLVKNGISTFSGLAATPVAQLKEILESAGSRYAIHDPGTWPAQSLLAANGEWENLKAYQGFLNAGKRPE